MMNDQEGVFGANQSGATRHAEPLSIENLAPAFFGLLTTRVSDRIVADGSRVASSLGIPVPARCMSTIITLSHGPKGVSEIARALGVSHVAAMKNIRKLSSLGFTVTRSDPKDARRKPIEFTPKGRKAARQLHIFVEHIRQVYLDIFSEIDVNVYDAMSKFEAALVRRSFHERLSEATRA